MLKNDAFLCLKRWRLITVYKWIYASSYTWTAENDIKIWLIIAVMHTTQTVVKLSLKKIQAWTGFEPMTSAIPVQCSTNWTTKPTDSWPLCNIEYTRRSWRIQARSVIVVMFYSLARTVTSSLRPKRIWILHESVTTQHERKYFITYPNSG